MSRHRWNLIKQSKHFYVRMYRGIGSCLVFLCALNVLLVLSVVQLYLSRKMPDFYATYGDTPPVELTPLNHPNESSTPLLLEDVGDTGDSIMKIMPQ